MRFLTRLITIALLLFTIHYLPFTGSALAQGEFESSYKVTYQVREDGKTDVIQNIVLKNKTDNFYADSFELKIGSTKVENVKAQDAQGPMAATSKFEDNVTTIKVNFNSRVIGIDKSLPWTLTYTTGDLAAKAGQIWEISIPRLAKSPEIATYDAKIAIPYLFGELSTSVPAPKKTERIRGFQEFFFDKDQLNESGIAMSFGKKQVFAFRLNYYIENNNLTSQFVTITLPPDNNYQKVVLEKIEPPPVNVTVDKDGNFIAKYKLGPKDQKDVVVEGYVEVFAKPFRNISAPLTDQERKTYTDPQTYWETDNAFVKDKARELKTAKAIYDFVAGFLKYNDEKLNLQEVQRKGAASAINSPKDAVCTEFTDLFIALARSAGIPAREVEGYAYTQNERLKPLSLTLNRGDILHAWPEYWDDTLGWVQIDPTWGSTSGGLDFFNKLDFNHITFVQRGTSSTFPYPAGSFKREGDQNKKSVSVEFAQELPQPTSTPELSLDSPDKILSGIPVKITATIKNSGSTSIIGGQLSLSTSKLEMARDIDNPQESQIFTDTQKIPILPPFSSQDFTFNLQTVGLFKSAQDQLILSFAEVEITRSITILPFYKVVLIPQFAASLGVALVIIATGLFLYFRLKKHKGLI